MGACLSQQLTGGDSCGAVEACRQAVGGQAHHTEHLWAGFMGESLGQWKARPNSSNWDTLPSTLGCGERP
jgi:hypothetical protein